MGGKPNEKPQNGHHHKTVLVVEDEVLLRITVSEDLEDAGFRVLQASNADEALRVLNNVDVDLMVTDITMPSGAIDGAELAKHVRANWPEIKIIILSSHISSKTQIEQADICLSKPIGMNSIVEHTKKLIGEDGS